MKKKGPNGGKRGGPSTPAQVVPFPGVSRQRKKKGPLGKTLRAASPDSVHHSQEVAALVEREVELREEKVRKVKAQLVRGGYQVETKEIAKAIARHEIARLLSEKAGSKKS